MVVNEIRLGRRTETLVELLAKGLIALAVLWIVLMLPGCSDDYERAVRQAEFNAKVARTALPREGELVTIRQLGEKGYIVRRYRGGLIATNVIKEDQ